MLLKVLKAFDSQLGLRNRLRGLPSSGFDLEGEKLLDWSWCMANLSRSPGQRILDVGCAQSPIVPAAIAMGHDVYGVDTDALPYQLPGLTFYRTDFLDCEFGQIWFDTIVLCSVVEHIGLAGRYGQRDIPEGDLQAMCRAAALLKPEGSLILTIPLGKDLAFLPWHRIYGAERLPRLLRGFMVDKERFLVKDPSGPWHPCRRAEALQVNRDGLSYALGQFLLKKGDG